MLTVLLALQLLLLVLFGALNLLTGLFIIVDPRAQHLFYNPRPIAFLLTFGGAGLLGLASLQLAALLAS